MGFLNPALFWGLGAISVPIIIHLLNRYRFRRTIWAAMEFLLEALEENSRRLQIQDIILLILRVLGLALLALALVRPTLTGEPPVILRDDNRAAVVILDNSYSMGYESLSKSYLEMAQQKAVDVLNELRGSRVALILMSDKADAVVAFPTSDIDLLQEIVKQAELSDGATDALASLQKAREILADQIPYRNYRYRLYILFRVFLSVEKGLEDRLCQW